MTTLDWLATVLRAAGLTVSECEGWKARGRPGAFGPIEGVLLHHTAGSPHGDMPSLHLIVNGRHDLPGPLSQLALGRNGIWHVVAAGRANHAGKGVWRGRKDVGNSVLIGIEAENTGLPGDPWPAVQMDAYRRGVAALLRYLHLPPAAAVGHKEYSPGRKPDPSFDMDAFRASLVMDAP